MFAPVSSLLDLCTRGNDISVEMLSAELYVHPPIWRVLPIGMHRQVEQSQTGGSSCTLFGTSAAYLNDNSARFGLGPYIFLQRQS